MKKQISILVFGLFLSLSAWAAVDYQHINCYATRLNLKTGTMNSDRTVKIEIYSMAPTNGVWVYLDMNEDEIINEGDINIYANETLDVTWDSNGKLYGYEDLICTIPESVGSGDYKWLVKVRGKQDHRSSVWSVPKPVRNYENTTYEYVKALGVAVDCAYESDYFGYSYVTEAYNNTTKNGKVRKEGVYSYGPAMGERNTSPYTGGHTWSSDDLANYYYEAGPFRTCTDDEGYVYICENRPQDDCEIKVFRLNPKNPTAAFDAVLTKTHIAKAESAMGISISRRVQSIAVGRDSEGKKILYVILAFVDTNGSSNGLGGKGTLTGTSIMCDFDISDLSKVQWNGHKINMHNIPYASNNTRKFSLINPYNSIELGNNGDFWVFQSRQGDVDAYPGSMHFNKEWKCDFVIAAETPGGTQAAPTAFNSRGIGALTKDASILAIPVAAGIGTEKIRFYDVVYDNTDKSKVVGLAKKYDLDLPTKLSPVTVASGYTTQHWVDGMDFDVANNLYFIGGTGKGANVNYYASRLYVYALPKEDNSHVTPARSSQRIHVPDGLITWHPYPNDRVTINDLWLMFQHDYDPSAAKVPIGQVSSFVASKGVREFLRNTPQWSWLYDFMMTTINPTPSTNVDLWNAFKPYYNSYYGLSRADQPITNVATFANAKMYEIMTNSKSEYKWLGDYIIGVAGALSGEDAWRWHAHAFFNANNGQKTDNQLVAAADFSSAGKPENWLPYSISEAKWKTHLHDFFNKNGVFSTRPDALTDTRYTTWKLQMFPTEVNVGDQLPIIYRDGYVFAGWYYGNMTGYNIDDQYNSANPKTGHLWARWIRPTLEEGYISSLGDESFSQQEIRDQKTNRNAELIACLLANTEYAKMYPISVNRKLQGGMYNTCMLPFDLTPTLRASIKDDRDNDLSEDAIMRFAGVTSLTTDGTTLYELNFYSDNGTIPAYEPFLIKPTADLTNVMSFANVVVEMDPGTTVADLGAVRFVPVLAPTEIGGEGANILLLVANNRLAKLVEPSEIKGLRGYFDATNIELSSASYAVRIVDKNGVTTYLESVDTPQQGTCVVKIMHNGKIYILRDGKVYTITGTRVK